MSKPSNYAIVLLGKTYPVIAASQHAGDAQTRQIHSLALDWNAPFMGDKTDLVLSDGNHQHAIRILSSSFKRGAQRLAFQYA